MSEGLTKRFEMRLLQGHVERLMVITERNDLPSRADAVRYLIDKEFKGILAEAKHAGRVHK